MYFNDSYSDLECYNGGRLFNFNENQNIWSSDKICSMDNILFNKTRNVNKTSIQASDRFKRHNRKPPGDRSETNLIVNYLPDGFYEKDLFELFSKAGPIVHYHIVRNKENRSECYGFVDYEKPSDAEKAIEMFDQYPIQNKKLKVQNAAEGLLIKEEERERAINGFNNIGYNVEIKNSPPRWNITEIKNIFGKFGEILKVIENVDEFSHIENCTEIKSKTFNVVYRYHAIAEKVVRRKNNQAAEPMWPLELKLRIIGQEIVEIPIDSSRVPRLRASKIRYDQMSDCSWDNKVEPKYINGYQKNYEIDLFNWTDSAEEPNIGTSLTSNGRPILKHKDNLMHLNGGMYEALTIDPIDKFSMIGNEKNNLYFDNKIRGSCQDIKAIWESKETFLVDPIPQNIFIKTPLLTSRFRNEDKLKYRANIWFKMENMQPTGSFKLRGLAYYCYKAKHEGIQQIVSSTGINTCIATAYACRVLKLGCIIVVPVKTPQRLVRELLKEKAEVYIEGLSWKESQMKAEEIVASMSRPTKLICPSECPLLWNGYESIVDEIVSDMRGAQIDLIVLSVGSGGLLNGIVQGISKNNLKNSTAILTMETEGADYFNRSISVNRPLSIVPSSVAISLGSPTISQRSLELYYTNEFHLFSKICSDSEAIDACCQFLNEQNCLVEPACGASLAALYNGTLDQMAEEKNCDLNVVIVVSGGRCIDIQSLLEMKEAYSSLPNPSSYDVSYDNLPINNVNDQFLTLNLNKEPYNHHSQSLDSDIFYPSNYDDSNVSNYHQTFPSLIKNESTNTAVKKFSNILKENKFGYQRNLNDNIDHYNNFHSLNQNNNIDDASYFINDLISSPVGSQYSDKENRMVLPQSIIEQDGRVKMI